MKFETSHDPEIPPLQSTLDELRFEMRQPAEQAVFDRIERFIATSARHTEPRELAAIADALHGMVMLHQGQEREPGVPYYRHPLLVTIMSGERFGIPFDVACRILSAYHDVPEDQFEKVGELFAGRPAASPEEAIDLIAARYAQVIPEEKIRTGLRLLTNPDFDSMVAALKAGDCAGPHYEHAAGLLEHAREARARSGNVSPLQPADLSSAELKRLLYLGHFAEIREASPEVFRIKLADFYTNGLHLHLLREKVAAMHDEDPGKQSLAAKADKLAAKYGPVVEYLWHELDDAAREGAPILGSAWIDRWYQGKIEYVWRHGYLRDPSELRAGE